MKKGEIFGMWLCLLGIYCFLFGTSDNSAFVLWVSIIAFVVGSIWILSSLWNRRKDK